MLASVFFSSFLCFASSSPRLRTIHPHFYQGRGMEGFLADMSICGVVERFQGPGNILKRPW